MQHILLSFAYRILRLAAYSNTKGPQMKYLTFRNVKQLIDVDIYAAVEETKSTFKQFQQAKEQNIRLISRVEGYRQKFKEMDANIKTLKSIAQDTEKRIKLHEQEIETMFKPIRHRIEGAIRSRELEAKHSLYAVYGLKRNIEVSTAKLSAVQADIETKEGEDVRDVRELKEVQDKCTTYEKELKILEQMHQKQVQDHVVVLKEIRNLQIQYKKHYEENEKLLAANKDFRRCHTPRPDWKEANDILPGLTEVPSKKLTLTLGRNLHQKATKPTQELLNQLTTEVHATRRKDLAMQLVEARHRREELEVQLDKILKELKKSKDYRDAHLSELAYDVNGAPRKEIMGLGTSIDVPQYLRIEGPVPLTLMPKVDVDNFIDQLWQSKALRDKQSGRPVLMKQHVYTYLQYKYSTHAAIAKFAYSFLYSLYQYSWDPHIFLFHKVLDEYIPEATYLDRIELLESIQRLLIRINVMEVGKSTGFVLKEDIKATFIKFFPNKQPEQLEEIMEAISSMNSSSIVDIKALFVSPSPEEVSPFIKVICHQHLVEIESFISKLKAELRLLDPLITGNIMILALPQLFLKIDPCVSKKTIDKYMAAGLHCRQEDLQLHMFSKGEASSSVKFINIDNFVHNMMSTLVKPRNNFIPLTQPVIVNANSRVTLALRKNAIRLWDLLRKRVRMMSKFKKPVLIKKTKAKKRKVEKASGSARHRISSDYDADGADDKKEGGEKEKSEKRKNNGGGSGKRRESVAGESPVRTSRKESIKVSHVGLFTCLQANGIFWSLLMHSFGRPSCVLLALITLTYIFFTTTKTVLDKAIRSRTEEATVIAG
jgi:hypothetical protein